MDEITDDYMRQMMTRTRPYTVVILSKGPRYDDEDARAIIWEHGRRNFELRRDGILAVVCPIRSDARRCGVGIFTTDADATRQVMDADPGVRAGILTYELHPTMSFPGDALPT